MPGCVAAGDTEEENRQNVQDALVAHLSVMVEIGASIPEPHSSVDYVEIGPELVVAEG